MKFGQWPGGCYSNVDIFVKSLIFNQIVDDDSAARNQGCGR